MTKSEAKKERLSISLSLRRSSVLIRCPADVLHKLTISASVEGVSRNTLMVDVLTAYVNGNKTWNFKSRYALLIEEVKNAVLQELKDNPPRAGEKGEQ